MSNVGKLGAGRVLGDGKGLSPAAATYSQRHSSLVSPSESSVSLVSSASTSPFSADAEDLSSRIIQEHGNEGPVAAAAASPKLACPICNEEMVTLLQLNRHLDDDHKNLEEIKQDEVKDWFKMQMVKAKHFQPLAVLNQKLKGLDVFESNSAIPAPSPRPSTLSALEARRQSPDEVITRQHWQRRGLNDLCSDPVCGKRLMSVNGGVNCRKCGKLFCEEHTMYQMKLSRSAQHEPVRGTWCRVCETCYKSRQGYNDHNGFIRDHTDEFKALRRATVDKTFLEVSRLEKRLTKLTQLLANDLSEQKSENTSPLWPILGNRSQRKQIEQSVVSWEEDISVPRCPFCQQEFSNYTFRRHHCRLCGRVVCGDPRTGCSTEIALDVAAPTNPNTEKFPSNLGLDIRICKSCHHIIFSRADFVASISHKPPSTLAYENLTAFEHGIRLLLPNFQRLLIALQDPDKPPSHTQLASASKIRKRLVGAFTQYNLAARRIRDLPTTSPTQQQLQKAIYQQASSFLHVHMLPLKSLPKILKHAQPFTTHSHVNPTTHPTSALTSIKYADIDASSQASASSHSSAISALEAEEKALREKLIVLEEQKFFVEEMIKDANRRRKFDEVKALVENQDNLEREIDLVRGELEGLDFKGVYAGGE